MSTTLSETERADLARTLIYILEQWQIPEEDQIALMGLGEQIKARHLSRFKNGEALPNDPEVMERARHLVGIHEAIEYNNPANPRVGFLWLKNRNKYFTHRTPLQVMLEDGLPGLHHVWVKLDCTQGWD